VADCHHLLKLRAAGRGITIHEVFEQGMPKIWGDERAIRQIVLNLLSNSIKFTPQGGEIWLKVGWTAAGGQYLSVKDTGPGIPENEIPIVLDTFGQGSNAIKSAEQGAGLGLPIVKSLIELHGGTFSLKSKLREGTEVVVTFPPERVMAALEPVVETVAPNIFDPPPTEPEMPDHNGHGAIGGFLASINFGRARRGRAKAATHLVVLLAAGHLLAPLGAAPDRSGLIATAHAHNWYPASSESRAISCDSRRGHAESFTCTVR